MAFHHNNHLSDHHQDLPLHHLTEHHHQQASQLSETNGPNWLNTALLRSQQPQPAQPHSSQFAEPNFLNLHTTRAASDSTTGSQAPNQWLSRTSSSLLHRNHSDVIDDVGAAPEAARGGGGESMVAMESGGSGNNNGIMNNNKSEGVVVESGGGGGDGVVNWQNARYKADILAHPLCEQLLSAHVACLRVATPVDQLPRIDAQLAQSQHVVAKYSSLSGGSQGVVADDKELDQFLPTTSVSPGEGTGATMSDDDDDQVDSDANLFDGSLEGPDSMGFGPLILTDSEKSLMERVRHELKHELKQGYKEKIVDIREEILRKRRAGKLPGDTTSVLKAWWQSHSKWPYPTEEDKARLVQETGLQLKQINNWFINQRKRNWNSNPFERSNAGENNGDRFM
ncbi:homeobox protein knotted-1-like 3 isoform X1 [Gossypium australe]|uniref:Homeobox protein knotted-1-like 3 isoform X1 n=1 Tax=Gossypium australe TaxID=47621 RepID=A0A5B6X004_9ROSI|nr:homeobox protein knotted-1-like 3 isoform X1 [Gossypium australe]